MSMTRHPAPAAILAPLAIFFFSAAIPTAGAASGNATTDTARGLHSTAFRTDRGVVEVHLPDDLAAGDTISGTVVARPSGDTPAATRRNSDRLQGYVVELEDQKAEVGSGVLTWAVPAAVAVGTLVLRDRRGREIARGRVPVAPATPPTSTGVTAPPVGQTGRPVAIDGPFDGRFDNSGVTIGGREARPLAESPRKLVVESPADVVGPTTMVVREGDTTFELPFRNVEVGLSAPRTDLGRGERTTVTAVVSGLDGLDTPVSLGLTNESTTVVEMEGGDSQTITIEPGEVGPDGRYVLTREIVGVTVGVFSISAQVPAPGGAGGPGPVAQARPGPEPQPEPDSEPAQEPSSTPAGPQPQPQPQPEPRPVPEDGTDRWPRAHREGEPGFVVSPGYVFRPEADQIPRCCCPKKLTIHWRPGPLEGDWPISRYWANGPKWKHRDGREEDWAGIFPVWGERDGDKVTNDDSVGPTDVPQVLRSQLKNNYPEETREQGLPEKPEDGVPEDARNIGWRYQVIAEYEWIESEREHRCELHWEKQNHCTELKKEGRLKPELNGTLVKGCDRSRPDEQDWYEIQSPGAFEPDGPPWDWRSLNTRKLPPGELDHPEQEIFVDTPQRIHRKGDEPREPIHFRWWIESPKCPCERPFLGAEATLRFVKEPGHEYPEPKWEDFRGDITKQNQFFQFSPRTHYRDAH